MLTDEVSKLSTVTLKIENTIPRKRLEAELLPSRKSDYKVLTHNSIVKTQFRLIEIISKQMLNFQVKRI